MADLIDRQAAINALDELCDRVCEYGEKHRSVMCVSCPLGSAFDVLENLSTPQPDCIRRQAVIDSLHRRFKDGFCGDAWWNSTIVLSAINETPSAQPERKTGRWKGEGMGDYRCSWCGEVSHPQTNFCPNCGADMRGGNDETD